MGRAEADHSTAAFALLAFAPLIVTLTLRMPLFVAGVVALVVWIDSAKGVKPPEPLGARADNAHLGLYSLLAWAPLCASVLFIASGGALGIHPR